MSSTLFKAMHTSWWIQSGGSEVDATEHHARRAPESDHLAQAVALVHRLESTLSRFREDSSVSRLNRERALRCPTLAAVTRLALALQRDTDGAFDPTLGAELAALGYDRSFDLLAQHSHLSPPPLAARRERTTVIVDGDHVRLEGPGLLDLGGIAKGYAVDEVVRLLVSLGATSVLVDGGGDLRGHGASFPIGVADGLVVETRHGAIATSSTRRRRWRTSDDRIFHHIIDPHSGRSAEGSLDTVTVIASTAATADALATALLVAPEKVLGRLPELGAYALMRSHDRNWWLTPGTPITEPLRTSLEVA